MQSTERARIAMCGRSFPPGILCRPEIDLEVMVQGIAKKNYDVLSMLSGFHSAVVDVGDFDTAVGDYARLLGQEPDWIEEDAERRTRSTGSAPPVAVAVDARAVPPRSRTP